MTDLMRTSMNLPRTSVALSGHQQTRFSGAEKIAVQLAQKAPQQCGSLYRAASQFLTMDSRFEDFLVKPLLKSDNLQTKRFGAFLEVLGKSFLPQDFAKRTPLFNWGKVGVRPPNGAMGITLYFGIIPSRMYAATKRPDIDKGEYLDILIRDVTGITFFLYALEPIRNFIGRALEKRRGIKFMQHGEALSYDALDDMYRVTHPNRLLQLARKPENHKGVRRALDYMANNRYMKAFLQEDAVAMDQFTRFKQVIGDMMKTVSKDKGLQKHSAIMNHAGMRDLAKEGYQLLHQLEHLANERYFGAARHVSARGLRVSGLSQVPSFKNMFARVAVGSRVGIDFAGFAIVTIFLGWGITRFNEWFTEYRHKKEQAAAKGIARS